MKEKFGKWFDKKMTKLIDEKAKARLSGAGSVINFIGLAAITILLAVGALGLAAGLFCLVVLLPGMVTGAFAWFVWTYLGLGAMYFATLDPVWLNIPYWHFALSFSAVIFAVRVFRKKGRQQKFREAVNSLAK